MSCLNLVVTDYADNGHSIERSKRLGHFLALFLKLLLAEIAPGLEIIGVIVVFDDSNRSRVLLQKMLADDDRDSFAVWPAINHHWFSCSHLSVRSND
jgi:hypothetical protein